MKERVKRKCLTELFLLKHPVLIGNTVSNLSLGFAGSTDTLAPQTLDLTF